MTEIIDTHCHLNDEKAFPDPEAEISFAAESGVSKLFVVGVDLEGSRRAISLAEKFPGAYAIVGHHPNYAHTFTSEALKEYEEMLAHPKTLAIGEIGLDFHWDYATREEQDRCLFAQLELAQSSGKPVVFHCREANEALLSILESREVLPYLFHCFSGTWDDASRALALGSYLGVDGPITYKKSDELREVLRRVPRERVVVETDSPYMAPVPYRGKPNRPAYVSLIVQELARVWEVTAEECASITTANARAFFALD